MLIIHPQDKTTDFLKPLYEKRDCVIINSNTITKKKLIENVKNHEEIVMLGHGDVFGLFADDRYIIDSRYAYLLREKNCIGIWCYASDFAQRYQLKGFFTGMFISQEDEAYLYDTEFKDNEIEQSNELFVNIAKESFDLNHILKYYNSNTNKIIKYNRNLLTAY